LVSPFPSIQSISNPIYKTSTFTTLLTGSGPVVTCRSGCWIPVLLFLWRQTLRSLQKICK
jgi:hypothetical protein